MALPWAAPVPTDSQEDHEDVRERRGLATELGIATGARMEVPWTRWHLGRCLPRLRAMRLSSYLCARSGAVAAQRRRRTGEQGALLHDPFKCSLQRSTARLTTVHALSVTEATLS